MKGFLRHSSASVCQCPFYKKEEGVVEYLPYSISYTGLGNHHRLPVGDLPLLAPHLLVEVARHLVLALHRLLTDSRTSRYIAALSSSLHQVIQAACISAILKDLILSI